MYQKCSVLGHFFDVVHNKVNSCSPWCGTIQYNTICRKQSFVSIPDFLSRTTLLCCALAPSINRSVAYQLRRASDCQSCECVVNKRSCSRWKQTLLFKCANFVQSESQNQSDQRFQLHCLHGLSIKWSSHDMCIHASCLLIRINHFGLTINHTKQLLFSGNHNRSRRKCIFDFVINKHHWHCTVRSLSTRHSIPSFCVYLCFARTMLTARLKVTACPEGTNASQWCGADRHRKDNFTPTRKTQLVWVRTWTPE